jgi:hypothetical protein
MLTAKLESVRELEAVPAGQAAAVVE